ncbi:MAG: type II toxin-antitoxin system VapC family toxin [Chloroflexota bacterium]
MSGEMVVIDASVAVKAVLPNPLQSNCLTLVESFVDDIPVAPALWTYETTSAIAKAVYFKDLTLEEGQRAIEQLDALSVHLFAADVDHNRAAFQWTQKLNRASIYDSYYLVLAQALGCDFWTADRRLFNALQEMRLDWVHWVGALGPE